MPPVRPIWQTAAVPRVPRLSENHVRLVHHEVADLGAWPGLEHFTEAQYDAELTAILRDRPSGPVGVFAYGSLIWRPEFPPAAELRATAPGWHRAFTLRLKRFRGTPEYPGLMMQIDRGGSCEGVVQIVPEGQEWPVLGAMLRREMTVRPPSYIPRWIEVRTGDTTWTALAFTANRESPNYAGRQSLDAVAACLAEACGHWGTGADYLLRTVAALEEHGFHDPELWALQERVAALIESRYPDAFARP